MLYVRPLYLRSESGKIPELKRVIVAYENKIAMEETLEAGDRADLRAPEIGGAAPARRGRQPAGRGCRGGACPAAAGRRAWSARPAKPMNGPSRRSAGGLGRTARNSEKASARILETDCDAARAARAETGRMPQQSQRGDLNGCDQSFDITTGCDLQEVDNAVNQAMKEIRSATISRG